MSDRFRTWVGHTVDEEVISWGRFDEEARRDGYAFRFEKTHHEGDESWFVRVYERRPPTVREAGDAMAEVLDGHVAGAEVARPHAEKLANDWREAVEREAS